MPPVATKPAPIPNREDPYSPLDLGEDDLCVRDRRVFEFARGEGVPLPGCWPGVHAGHAKGSRGASQHVPRGARGLP